MLPRRRFSLVPVLAAAALVLAAAVLAGCGGAAAPSAPRGPATAPSADTPAPRSVSLALNWFPEAEHGGFYAAEVHGYFAEEGLAVEILPGGPGAPVIQQTALRRTDFAIANADQVLQGRAQDADVAALFAALQTSPRCILVHRESGITRLEDLRDVTLAITPGRAFGEFLQQKLPLENVRITPYSGNVAQFVLDKQSAQQGYVFSEPFAARRAGADPVALLVADLGFNPYTSLLIAHGELVRDEPDLVRRMVRACRRGWEQYLADPEPTNARIHELNPEMDLETLAYGAEALKPLCLPQGLPPDQLGGMTLARWRTLAEQLVELKLLDADRAAPAEAFTTVFLAPPPAE